MNDQVPAKAPDQRFWEEWLKLAYEVDIGARVAGRLRDRWRLIAGACAILAAVTSTSSTVAGWTLWKTDGGQLVWGLITGAATLLAVATAGVNIKGNVSTQSERAAKTQGLLARLESFRRRKIRRGISVDEAMQKELDAFEDEWLKVELPDDIFYTDSLKQAVQLNVDAEYAVRGWLMARKGTT